MDLRAYLVRDAMTSPVISVSPVTPLVDAAIALRGNFIRHLPVVQDGILCGLVSDRDIQRCTPSRLMPITEELYNSVFDNTRVENIMSRDPQTVTSDTSLLSAIAHMQSTKYGCLPVVDNAELVGIITRSDLLNVLQLLLSGRTLEPK